MSRGKLPRSWKIPSDDTLFSTTAKTNAYLYDSALAIIATVGAKRYTLSTEILNGLLLTQQSAGQFPFRANHIDASVSEYDYPNSTIAMIAYAIGYYLEMNPFSDSPSEENVLLEDGDNLLLEDESFILLETAIESERCVAEEILRNILQYLQRERDWLYGMGLIYTGMISGTYDKSFKTETNLLAYYAFKQAAKVFSSSFYDDAAFDFREAIILKLWSGDKLNFGLSSTGVLDTSNALQVYALGAIFMSEIEQTEKAIICLNKCEIFSTVDAGSGAIGYTGFLGSPDHVWFEMSYAVAMAYYRSNNLTKYQQIISELNRYADDIDGGFKGTLIKDYIDESMVAYEAIGSTAWSIIVNVLKGSAFRIRTSESLASTCEQPYYNTEQSQGFTKDDCGEDTNPTSYTYVVPAGRYISYTSVSNANTYAATEISTFGQAYTNLTGTCISTASVGNQLRIGSYTKEGCGEGYHGSNVVTRVFANTFFAVDLDTANGLADAYIAAHGQDNANATGTCIADYILNYILINVAEYGDGELAINVHTAGLSVSTNISVDWTLYDGNGTSYGSQSPITFSIGDTAAYTRYIISPATLAPYSGQIDLITPEYDYSGNVHFVHF